jgi:hypothetical protein
MAAKMMSRLLTRSDPTSQQLTTHDDDDEHDDNGTGRRRTHANPLHQMRDLVHEHGANDEQSTGVYQ